MADGSSAPRRPTSDGDGASTAQVVPSQIAPAIGDHNQRRRPSVQQLNESPESQALAKEFAVAKPLSVSEAVWIEAVFFARALSFVAIPSLFYVLVFASFVTQFHAIADARCAANTTAIDPHFTCDVSYLEAQTEADGGFLGPTYNNPFQMFVIVVNQFIFIIGMFSTLRANSTVSILEFHKRVWAPYALMIVNAGFYVLASVGIMKPRLMSVLVLAFDPIAAVVAWPQARKLGMTFRYYANFFGFALAVFIPYVAIVRYLLRTLDTDFKMVLAWLFLVMCTEVASLGLKLAVRQTTAPRLLHNALTVVPMLVVCISAKRFVLLGLATVPAIIGTNVLVLFFETALRLTAARRALFVEERWFSRCCRRPSEAKDMKASPLIQVQALHIEFWSEMIELASPIYSGLLVYVLNFAGANALGAGSATLLLNAILQIGGEVLVDTVCLYLGSHSFGKQYRVAFDKFPSLFGSPGYYLTGFMFAGCLEFFTKFAFVGPYLRIGRNCAGIMVATINKNSTSGFDPATVWTNASRSFSFCK